jgi:TonB family protein
MKKAIFISIIAFINFNKLYAQEKYNSFKLDTINIKGIVYDYSGKPLPDVLIFVKGKAFPKQVYTDKKGQFELSGAEVKDSIIARTLTNVVVIKNNGSRYIYIEFPIDHVYNIGFNNIGIASKRKFPKKPIPEIKMLVESNFPNYGHPAHFPGGESKFIALIKEKIAYPEKAIENNIEGEVEIGFTVGKDGSLNKIKVVRGIGYGCEEQVVNAIRTSPKWVPAIYAAQPVEIPSSITISFKLTDK